MTGPVIPVLPSHRPAGPTVALPHPERSVMASVLVYSGVYAMTPSCRKQSNLPHGATMSHGRTWSVGLASVTLAVGCIRPGSPMQYRGLSAIAPNDAFACALALVDSAGYTGAPPTAPADSCAPHEQRTPSIATCWR